MLALAYHGATKKYAGATWADVVDAHTLSFRSTVVRIKLTQEDLAEPASFAMPPCHDSEALGEMSCTNLPMPARYEPRYDCDVRSN